MGMPGNNSSSSNNNNNSNNSSIKASAAGAGASPGAAAPPVVPLKCPRCESTNTKFCYYNNYSLAQPRHFCKACKRYWTRGGTLRNVPVGGGCRKNKRPKRQSSHVTAAAAASSSNRITGLVPGPGPIPLLPPLSHLDVSSVHPLLFAAAASSSSAMNQIPVDLQPHVKYQLRGGCDEFPLGQIQQPEFPLLLGHSSSLLPNSIASLLELNGKAMESAAAAAAASNHINDRVEWLPPCEGSFESAGGASNLALNPTDSPYFYWNSALIGGGSWADAANCGPSIAPLL